MILFQNKSWVLNSFGLKKFLVMNILIQNKKKIKKNRNKKKKKYIMNRIVILLHLLQFILKIQKIGKIYIKELIHG